MSSPHQIPIQYPETAEAVTLLLKLAADPTGNTVEFQLIVDQDVSDAPALGSWSAGSWVGSWNDQRKEARAQTPLIGLGQTLDVKRGGRYRLLCRPDLGSGRRPIIDCGRVTVAGSDDHVHGA